MWIEEEKTWEKKNEGDIEISLELYLNNYTTTSVVKIPIGGDEIKSREFNSFHADTLSTAHPIKRDDE